MKVDINLDGVMRKLSETSMDRGRYALASQALSDMNIYVPMQNNPLRESGQVAADNKSISWNTPYAKAQFYGYVGKGYRIYNYTTPGTGPRWDLKAKANHMRDWEKAYIKGAGW